MTVQNNFSPLLRLYKYRPTIKNTPKENFLTEAFALRLFYNSAILKLFLKHFCGVDATTNFIVETQVRTQNKKLVFDLILTDNKSCPVFIECKFGTGIGK